MSPGPAAGRPSGTARHAALVGLVAFLLPWGALGLDYAARWTPLQRLYFAAYLRSGSLPGQGRYHLITVVSPQGRSRALDRDVLYVTQPGRATVDVVRRATSRHAAAPPLRPERIWELVRRSSRPTVAR